MKNYVIRADSIPALVHRTATPRRTLGMEYALGLAGGAGGVNQERRISGGGLGIIQRRTFSPPVRQISRTQRNHTRRRLHHQIIGHGNHLRPGIGQQKIRFFAGQLCG